MGQTLRNPSQIIFEVKETNSKQMVNIRKWSKLSMLSVLQVVVLPICQPQLSCSNIYIYIYVYLIICLLALRLSCEKVSQPKSSKLCSVETLPSIRPWIRFLGNPRQSELLLWMTFPYPRRGSLRDHIENSCIYIIYIYIYNYNL